MTNLPTFSSKDCVINKPISTLEPWHLQGRSMKHIPAVVCVTCRWNFIIRKRDKVIIEFHVDIKNNESAKVI